MTCSLFDVPCKVWSFIEPFWTWLVWGFWIIVALVALWVLKTVKDIGGWAAVGGVLVTAAVAVGYVLGRGSMAVQPRGKPGKHILTRDEVKALQSALAARGLYAGMIDGVFGAQSQKALTTLQRQLGHTQTGLPTRELLDALGVKLERN